MQRITGLPASGGVAIGPAFRWRRAALDVSRAKTDDPTAEWARFQAALQVAGEQLEQVCVHAEAQLGAQDAAIFRAHQLMLDDPDLLEAVQAHIQEQGVTAECALNDAAETYVQLLQSLGDEYLSARAADVRDVAHRLICALQNAPVSLADELTAPAIIVAPDLTPSDTVLLDKALVLGFCTAEGGATSHTAILARGLGLPAVVGAGPTVLAVPDQAALVLDGDQGAVLVTPDTETVAAYRARQATDRAAQARAQSRAHEPAITRDGRRIEVVANVGNVAGAQAARNAGAEGIGLLRTEFLYLERAALPDEEEQYRAYRAIADVFGPQPVVLRTLDIGGDKELPYLDLPREMNPFLGLRAMRLCLARPDLIRPQLRAALRAGAGRNLKIMFPMIATVAEVRAARAMLDECRAELAAQGQPVAEGLEVGIMVEIPAAAVMADRLAAEVDFFSIGTNDLSQYTLAADRTNAQVAGLASAFQPAVLRLVAQVITAAHARGKWVGLCGELAGEPLAVPILLGLGLDEFSMNPPAIPRAKEILRSLSWAEAREIARAALDQDDPEAIQSLVCARAPATQEES